MHQHLFCARLDLDVDGAVNEVHEVERRAGRRPATTTRGATRFAARSTTRLEREHDGAARRRLRRAAASWKVVNPAVRNAVGEPVGYKLIPGATPTLLAAGRARASRKRAGFATAQPVGHAVRADERRAAGDYPNQHAGGDGLPRWTAADRSLVDTDVVLWYTFGVTHVPRPEDWPVMPVERCGFLLSPVGFFDRTPPSTSPPHRSHCH